MSAGYRRLLQQSDTHRESVVRLDRGRREALPAGGEVIADRRLRAAGRRPRQAGLRGRETGDRAPPPRGRVVPLPTV